MIMACATMLQTPCKDALEIVKDLLLGISREMEILSRLPPNRMFDSESKWRCMICPFSGAAPRILYSHYQFHQQLLTSGCKYLFILLIINIHYHPWFLLFRSLYSYNGGPWKLI